MPGPLASFVRIPPQSNKEGKDHYPYFTDSKPRLGGLLPIVEPQPGGGSVDFHLAALAATLRHPRGSVPVCYRAEGRKGLLRRVLRVPPASERGTRSNSVKARHR